MRTVAVLPFDNETPVPELQRELFDAHAAASCSNRLNLRDAAESKADAVVRGTIVRTTIDVPIGYSADPRAGDDRARGSCSSSSTSRSSTRRRGKHAAASARASSAKGEYAERDEAGGRRQAIDEIIADIIEGAQSQW